MSDLPPLQPSELKPPEQWAHLRWHLLTDAHNKIDLCEWVRDVVDASDDTWLKFGDEREFSPAGLYVSGWRYDKSCDPAAIVPDPKNHPQRLAVESAIIDNQIDPEASFVDRMLQRKAQVTAVLTALARLGAGT